MANTYKDIDENVLEESEGEKKTVVIDSNASARQFVEAVLKKEFVEARESFKEMFYKKSLERLEEMKKDVAEKMCKEKIEIEVDDEDEEEDEEDAIEVKESYDNKSMVDFVGKYLGNPKKYSYEDIEKLFAKEFPKASLDDYVGAVNDWQNK